MKENYWGKYWRRRVSRRRVLAGGATLAAGSAAILAGCGDDDDDDGSAAPAATQAAATQAAAAEEEATEAAAAQEADAGAEDQPEEQVTEAEDRSRYGGTMSYSYPAYPTGFDPSITITFPFGMATTYSQLMAFSILEDEFYPDAAQSWEQVDPETLVFNLREGVRFNPEASEGREVTSEDWYISLRRYPDSRANRGSNVNELFFSFMDENQGATFDTPDDLTLRINQNKAFASNTRAFAAASLVVVSPERLAAEESGDLGQVSGINAGSGPYMFDDVGETRISLKRNPNYYEHPEDIPGTRFNKDMPYIDAMDTVIITDGAALQARFLAGDADYYGAVDKITADQWEGQPNVNMITGPAIDDGGIMIQLAAAKWTPYPELSKALSMAMDWDGYIDVVLGGEGRRSAPVSPTAFPNYALSQEEIREYQVYDPQGARQLWEANNGPEIFPELDTTVAAWVADYSNVQFIGQSFEDSLGVKVNYNPLELATYIASANGPTGTKDWHFFIAGNNAVSTMPDWNALVAYTPDGYGAIWGGNWYKGVNISDPWVNEENPNYAETGGSEAGEAVRAALEITHPYARELQDYADRQAATTDDEERADILKELQRRIFTRYCCTFPLPTPTTKYVAVGSRLKGLPQPPDTDQTASFGMWRAHNIWLEG